MTRTELNTERRKLCQELPLIMERLHRFGLHETGHKMHEVVKSVGYEAARLLDKPAPRSKGY